MKTGSKLKTGQVAPRKISVLLCQVPAATSVSFNVGGASGAEFAVQQKRV
jgi:hypothetical protein